MSLWQQLIYVLLRATIFIRESGFSELSVAIWQGLIELNFCGPKSPEEPVDRIKTFGEFWETELPRVGEENALGWNHFVQQSGDIDAPGSIIDATTNELDGNGLFRSWSAAERRRHNASSLPARTLDDVAEDDPYRQDAELARKIFSGLSTTLDLAEYYMAFEWKNEPATIKKVCKGLLKQHPTSLRLYNAYAMIEAARGNRDVSNNSLTSTPATLLRTKQYLRSNRDYLLSSGNFYHAALHTELLALLEYLTTTSPQETQSSTQGNITSALTIYTTLSTTLTIHPTAHELLLQSSARLLHHHARTGPFRPALLRQHLTTYLTLFPSNTIFLSLYTWNESRLRIENRVRAILHSTVLLLEHDVLTSRIFAITYEIQHGTIHSARSAFEHAVASPACRASPALWRLYLLYCLQTPEFVGMAKDIWYRALNACPWAKELYVLGLERLEGIVAFEELRRTWRVMGEKELRVHVDLEERFEDMVELEEGRKMGRLGFRQ
ncbi:putative UPF0614 protein like protein [Glarea lozoyensis 74030]|uniref:Putative UPF0614 protein like protein n=1 Tax=Glarea lozoyensis (strain ATCC 74030 / MF5533) TaxID=1104152 RepID=H0ETN6_GLAL7|nr:putative UPF0614 protein like protein [Glarea lozoyensis 74030]